MNVSFRALGKILLVLLVLLPAAVQAQEKLSQHIDLGDGYTISMPRTWSVENHAPGSFSLDARTMSILLATPTRLQELGVDPDETDPEMILMMYRYVLAEFPDVDAIEQAEFDERAAVSLWSAPEEGIEQWEVALTLGDGKVGYLAIFALEGEIEANRATIEDIIASFDVEAADIDTDVSASGVTDAVTCMVSADAADSAQLRVGPGTNRGAISFLPAGVDVLVTGRIDLDDGGVWYQLDKAQAAPNGTAAAELWVAAEAVDATGGCDRVGDTSAPPVIPAAPQPVQPASDSGGETAPGEPVPGATGLPSGGTWVFNMNPTTNASCEGTQNISLATTEFFESLSQVYAVRGVNRDTFNYGESNFTRVSGTNNFFGTFTFDEGYNAQIRFELLSATSMRGSVVGNLTFDGVACSFTVLFSTNRR